MKAVQFSETGGPDVLEYVDMLKPSAGPGEVLVRAEAFGVGKPDVLLRTGVYKWMPPLPAVIGNEMAGVIEAVGSGVSDFAMGQRVLVFGTGGGRHAEYNAVPTDIITPLTENIAMEDAVSIPNYAIAWCLLFEVHGGAEVRRVYVNGAAGGVGSAVVDICRHAGIEVIAGAGSKARCAAAEKLGATHTIDYSTENGIERVDEITKGEGVTLVLDQLIGPSFTDSLAMLAPLGTIISFNALAGMPDKNLFVEMRANLAKSPAVRCFSWHSYDRAPEMRARILDEVVNLFDAGAVKPLIAETLPLSEARRAHEILDARENIGKIVLVP